MDCLRYWVLEMHVDGFRFDLASIMTRAHSVWQQPADHAATAPQKAETPPRAASARTNGVRPVISGAPTANGTAPHSAPSGVALQSFYPPSILYVDQNLLPD